MDRLTSMTVFARVAATCSFSTAARELGISQGTVTKHVQSLEAWFGSRLLNRTTRRVVLTEAGSDFFRQCARILEDMDAALEAGKPDACLQGTLRVSAPVAFGGTGPAKHMVEFMRLSPSLLLSITLNDRAVDVIEEGFDIALAIHHPSVRPEDRSGLLTQTVAMLPVVLCAAPSYLAQSGTPRVPSDLAAHACLTGTRVADDVWHFFGPTREFEVPVSGQLRSNNSLLRRSAALAGAGVLLAPAFMVADELVAGRLQPLLPDYTPCGAALDAVVPRQRATTCKVQRLIGFLADRMKSTDLGDGVRPNVCPATSAG